MLPVFSKLRLGNSRCATECAPVGVRMMWAPPEVCPVCLQSLYECERVQPKAKAARKDPSEEDPNWTQCSPEEWSATKNPVEVLNACGHYMHASCLYKWLAKGAIECPVCRIPYSGESITYKIDGSVEYTTTFVEGRKTKIELPDGNMQFYEGAKGAERLVRVEYPAGHKEFYEGAQGEERRVRAEHSSGHKFFYEGAKGEEQLVRREFPDGTKVFLEHGEDGKSVARLERPENYDYWWR